MDYGIYINNKLMISKFSFVEFVPNLFEQFEKQSNTLGFFLIFWCIWCIFIIKLIFCYDIRIMCLFLYIWSWKNVICWKDVPEVWTVLVRNTLGCIWGILVLNGPLTSLKHRGPRRSIFFNSAPHLDTNRGGRKVTHSMYVVRKT